MGEEQEEQENQTQSEGANAEAETPEDAQQTKVLRLEMRIDPEVNQRLEKFSNYAALEGMIPSDHRGNKTAWINYCLMMGEEVLREHAYKKRGF